MIFSGTCGSNKINQLMLLRLSTGFTYSIRTYSTGNWEWTGSGIQKGRNSAAASEQTEGDKKDALVQPPQTARSTPCWHLTPHRSSELKTPIRPVQHLNTWEQKPRPSSGQTLLCAALSPARSPDRLSMPCQPSH
jgi:hypothetical protein